MMGMNVLWCVDLECWSELLCCVCLMFCECFWWFCVIEF